MSVHSCQSSPIQSQSMLCIAQRRTLSQSTLSHRYCPKCGQSIHSDGKTAKLRQQKCRTFLGSFGLWGRRCIKRVGPRVPEYINYRCKHMARCECSACYAFATGPRSLSISLRPSPGVSSVSLGFSQCLSFPIHLAIRDLKACFSTIFNAITFITRMFSGIT